MAYNGSVEVVSGLKQKNGANFPIVEASAVYVADGKSLSDIISGIEDVNIKEYIDSSKQFQQVVDDFGNRISTVESTIGTMTGGKTIAQKLVDIDNEIGLNASSANNTLKTRVTTLENDVGNGKVTDRINTAVNVETTRATTEENGIKTRVTSLESVVGNALEEVTIETIEDIVNETARSVEAEDALNYRIEYLEELSTVMSISDNDKYETHLNTITDADGNVLAYFDTQGNFHVNGNIYCDNW